MYKWWYYRRELLFQSLLKHWPKIESFRSLSLTKLSFIFGRDIPLQPYYRRGAPLFIIIGIYYVRSQEIKTIGFPPRRRLVLDPDSQTWRTAYAAISNFRLWRVLNLSVRRSCLCLHRPMQVLYSLCGRLLGQCFRPRLYQHHSHMHYSAVQSAWLFRLSFFFVLLESAYHWK